MALGDYNISTTAVGTEIGNSSHTLSVLVGASGLNKYSRYAPGQLDVDGNYDVTLTPPVSNYKLGDFRRYNNSAFTPGMQSPFTHYWGPGGTTDDITFGFRPEEMNIKAFVAPGDYVTVKVYPSAPDRVAQTNLIKTQIFPISWNVHTPLTGHTRQVFYVANTGSSGNLVTVTSLAMTPGDSVLYFETFISDIAGNRKINFGVRANNYLDINTHQRVAPYVHGFYNGVPATPSGYTALFAACNPTTTPAIPSQISVSVGTYYNFCVIPYGVGSSPPTNRYVSIANADIDLYINDVYAETLVSNYTFDSSTGLGHNIFGDLVSHSFTYDTDYKIMFGGSPTTDGLTYYTI
jgi:hypothetical protein